MAGYVIHLAVAEQYINKHKKDIESYEEFINGVIFPDDVSDKSTTHYGPKSSKVNLKDFFDNNELDNSFIKGYCLHLITDYLFYNKFLEFFSKEIYNDYDILNKKLIERYNVKIPHKIKDRVYYHEGKLKILDYDKIIDFIEKASEYRIEDVREEVLNNNKYWLTFKNLHKE